MRLPVILSLATHGLAAGLMLLQWPQIGATPLRDVEVVPVDILVGEVTDVAATAPPLPESEAAPVEPPPPTEAAPTPEPTPVEPRSREATQQQPLDVADLRRRLLENRDAPDAGIERPPNARPGEQVRRAAGRSAQETADLAAYFAALAASHIDRNQCWTDPVGRLEAVEFRLYVTVTLTDRGMTSSVSAPREGSGIRLPQAVLDDAVRAARACAPYPFPRDPNGPENYDLWRQMELCFGTGCRANN